MSHCMMCDDCPLTAPQTKELPHELHITIENIDDKNTFKEVCAELGVKPVYVSLRREDKEPSYDLMTSSIAFGDSKQAYAELDRISFHLEILGYKIIRKKIESAPWHPLAPTEDNHRKMQDGMYFECHIGIGWLFTNTDALNEIASKHNGYLSKNEFKSDVYMLTLRSYTGTYEDFLAIQRAVLDELEGYRVDKVITEFTWYDSNPAHDNAWMN